MQTFKKKISEALAHTVDVQFGPGLVVPEDICSMLEYFEIFLQRMLMCRRACEMLGAKFKMTANGSKIV